MLQARQSEVLHVYLCRFRIQALIIGILFLFLSVNCQSETESFLNRVDELIKLEKYSKARDLLQDRLSSTRDTAEVISRNSPRRERILRMSEDRNRILWTEDNRLIFRDILNPIIKTRALPEPPHDIQVSSNGEYVVASFQLKNTKGCRMFAFSTMDDSLSYESGAHIACRNKAGISSDGKFLYYFIDENLYKEQTKAPKRPQFLVDASLISPPYPKLKNKYSIVPVDSDFLVISGIAGSYNLYFFDPKLASVDLIAKDIISPKTYYSHGKSLYIIGGKIGSLYLREVLYKGEKKPKITTGFQITMREIEPWKMTDLKSFLSFYNKSVFIWEPMSLRKELPLLCERGWGVAMDMIVYENSDGELILSNTAFTEEEWQVFRVYQEVLKKAK